jgi:hypothetical protein
MAGEIEFDVHPEHIGNAEVTGYLDSKIERVRQMVGERPRWPFTKNLSVQEIQEWFNRFLCVYGKALGSIEYAANFGHISQGQAIAMEMRLKFCINFHTGSVIIGR